MRRRYPDLSQSGSIFIRFCAMRRASRTSLARRAGGVCSGPLSYLAASCGATRVRPHHGTVQSVLDVSDTLSFVYVREPSAVRALSVTELPDATPDTGSVFSLFAATCPMNTSLPLDVTYAFTAWLALFVRCTARPLAGAGALFTSTLRLHAVSAAANNTTMDSIRIDSTPVCGMCRLAHPCKVRAE